MYLAVSNLSKFYGDRQVLRDVSFTLDRNQRKGLVGANGAGKSTLLKILVGTVAPDGGEIGLGPGVEVGYLPQTVAEAAAKSVDELLREAAGSLHRLESRMRALEGAMATANSDPDGDLDAVLAEYTEIGERFERRGGYELEYRQEMVLAGLDLAGIEGSRPVAALSGGEKTRLCLAALLLSRPDLLLLDEPTNHLDFGALAWLESYLAGYPGGVLVVSHDRHFLNRTVTAILEVDEYSGQVKQYTGNYDDYAQMKAQERIRWREEYERQQAEIGELRQVIKGKARQVAHNRPARDNDKFLKNFKQERIDTAVARNVGAAEEKLRRIESNPIPEPPDSLSITTDFAAQALTSGAPLVVSGLSKSYGPQVVLADLTFALGPRSRVVVVGANGSGKSTLLRLLAGQIRPDRGEVTVAASAVIGYLDQEQETLAAEGTVYEVYSSGRIGHFEEIKAELLRYGLFTWPDLLKPVRALSIGQKRKLQIARLIASGANLLLLDEPTNHISFEVLEAFEEALLDFPGPVLAVSHDRRFIQRFADEVWALREGGLVRYPGGWEVFCEGGLDIGY